MKKIFMLLALLMVSAVCFADTDPAAKIANAAASFYSQVVAYIDGFGGQTWLFKVSSIIMLVIAIIKVTPLNALWVQLEGKQIWLAPLFGLVGGIVTMAMNGTPISLASVMAFVTAGAGAVFLHELLDLLKSIPGIGSFWVSIITVIEGTLGGQAAGVAAKKSMALAK